MKRITILIILINLAMCYVWSQPSSLEVTPGSKGTLPTTPTLPPPVEGRFAGLEFKSTGVATLGRLNATLTFPPASTFESTGGYYLKTRIHGGTEWERSILISNDTDLCSIELSDNHAMTDAVLEIVDGPNRGLLSNEVTVDWSSCMNTSLGYSNGGEMYNVIGVPVGDEFELYATTYTYYDGAWHSSDYTNEDGYYRYQWYRRNPNNYELTAINGANKSVYTPTIDDCGYSLVLEITGDGQHCGMVYHYNFGEIYLPIEASLSYVGDDGFVLNTEYDVPVDCFVYNNEFAFNENSETITDGKLPEGTITKKKSGQYAFRIPADEYSGVIYDVDISGCLLSFVYMAEWNDPPTKWYREAQVMPDRYMQSLVVKPIFNGAPLTTTVEAYAPNIDDELTLVGTAEANGEEGATFDMLPAFGIGCYIKAVGTSATSETYYPSTLLWTESTPVVPGVDDDWEPISVTIEVKPAFAALTGTGVIEGSIVINTPQQAKRLAAATNDGVMVYLQKKGGDIIASCETSATGDYRFENVPMGSYVILVNIDGCTMASASEVTLTTSEPNASDVDYVVNGTVISPAGESGTPTSIATNTQNATPQATYTLDGRRGLTRGLNIIRMSDGTVRKVMMK